MLGKKGQRKDDRVAKREGIKIKPKRKKEVQKNKEK